MTTSIFFLFSLHWFFCAVVLLIWKMANEKKSTTTFALVFQMNNWIHLFIRGKERKRMEWEWAEATEMVRNSTRYDSTPFTPREWRKPSGDKSQQMNWKELRAVRTKRMWGGSFCRTSKINQLQSKRNRKSRKAIVEGGQQEKWDV